MRKVLIVVCCLMNYVAAAQEQITRFENRGFETPNTVQKLDTINGKLIFFINHQDKDGSKLWVTDGKPENTHLLLDEEGNALSGTPWTAKAYGYLYMSFPYDNTGLYRTKGVFLEKISPKPRGFSSFNHFNGKLLTSLGDVVDTDTIRYVYSSLNWLNVDNTITRLAGNVLAYDIIDSTLHYITKDYKTGNFELCKIDKKGLITCNLIQTKGEKINIESFRYFSEKGHDFYFFDTINGRKMVFKPQDTNEAVSLIDWGDYRDFPLTATDTSGQLYFLKNSGQLKLFTLKNNGNLEEIWLIPLEIIQQEFTSIYDKQVGYGDFQIIDNKLAFTSRAGDGGYYKLFLNVYDPEKVINKRSKNILPQISPTYLGIKFSQIDTDIYSIDNSAGTRFTYNFSTDSLTNIEKYPFKFPYQKDTLVTINHETLLLKNNIYNITNGIKTPLLPTREIFYQYDNHYFTYKNLGDRMIFLKYNPLSRHSEIWTSRGEKDDIQLIADIEDNSSYIYTYNENNLLQMNDRLYFYTKTNEDRIVFYEIDGTREGTRKVYETTDPSGVEAYQTKINDEFIVFGMRGTESIGKILVLENDNARLISFPLRQYYEVLLSNNEVYILCWKDTFKELYKVIGNEAQLIDSSIEQVSIYQDYMLYSKNVDSQGDIYALFTVDKANKPVRFVAHNISTYSIVGSRLIYAYRINQGLVTSIFDLDAAKLEIDKMIGVYDDARIYLNNTLIMVRSTQALFIKGTNVKVFEIGFPARHGLAEFAGGVLFIGERDILYYDMATGKSERVLRNKAYNVDAFKRGVLKESSYFLIQLYNADYSYQWAYWALSEKQLNYLNDTISSFTSVNPVWAISATNNNFIKTYWHYNGWHLLKKYPFQLSTTYTNILEGNGSAFAFFKTKEKGNELYQFGPDSLIAFPEIVKGAEGMEEKHLFVFNKQIYVYGFTYTHGWQVWKMGESKVIITGTEPTDEPKYDIFVIYPNPTQDLLYVKTEKALPYRLINTRGQVLFSGNLNPQQGIDIRQLPHGVYLVQVLDRGKVFVGKIVKE